MSVIFEDFFLTNGSPWGPVAPPDTPVLLAPAVSTTGVTTVTLSWTSTSVPAPTSYTIFRNSIQVGTTTSLTYVDSPTTYAVQSYTVAANNANGSSTSAPVTVDLTAITDDFNRANSATSLGTTAQGYVWQAQQGVWGITTNTAYKVTATAQGTAVIDTGLPDFILEVTLLTKTNDGGGICFRSTDLNNHWMTEAAVDGGWLYKVSAGSYATRFSIGGVFAIGETVRVEAIGSSITVFRNNVQALTMTDAFNQTATKHGLRDYTGTVRMDNWSAKRFLTAPPAATQFAAFGIPL